MNKILCCAALLAAALFTACDEPESYEQFVKAPEGKGIAADNLAFFAEFEFPMKDASKSYDLSFYTRVDLPAAVTLQLLDPMRLDVEWFSPACADSAAFAETVYLDGGMERGVVKTYRTAVSPRPVGNWKIKVCIPETPRGFRGLGMICKRNDGTR